MKTIRKNWKGLVVLGTAGALGLSMFAGTASAAIPGGVACQSADGKISGRGATFAKQLWERLINEYRDDVCGAVPNSTGLQNGTTVDPAGSTNTLAPNAMVVYNYPTAQTGSGQGRLSAQCRTDAFGGSDGPYSNAQYTALNGAPLAATACPPGLAGATTISPFLAGPFGGVGATVPIMSFPMGGASNVIAVNLTSGCTTIPTALQLTSAMVDGLFDGSILTWGDARLRAGGLNADLATCGTFPVQRRVRSDDSGTTQIQKNYLAKIDPSTAAASYCAGAAAGMDWPTLRNAAAPNNAWPNLPQVNPPGPSSAAATATCSQITSANGNPGVSAAVNTTPGAVGYIDVADATVSAPNAIQASIRNATDTAFLDPANGSAANCNFGTVAAPGGTNGAVGLTAVDNWSSNNNANAGAPPNRSDVTFDGPGYPICGMTFALVHTGSGDTNPANDPVPGLTANQRRTLYSFMSFALSNAGQDELSTALYQRIPTSLANTIRRGFQANF